MTFRSPRSFGKTHNGSVKSQVEAQLQAAARFLLRVATNLAPHTETDALYRPAYLRVPVQAQAQTLRR